MIGNYCSHAIDAIEKGGVRKEMALVHQLLVTAAKFSLPDGGQLLDKKITEEDVRNMRMPYPAVALEYVYTTQDDKRYKMIVLVQEIDDGEQVRIFIVLEREGWRVHKHYNQIRRNAEFVPSGYMSEFFCLGDNIKPSEGIVILFGNAAKVVFDFMAVMNCKNIETKRVAPPHALSKKREKNGKAPLFEYHEISVKHERVAKGDSLGGHHAPHRLHWVRGHIRHFEGGGQTFVRPHTRGSVELGKIEKGYKL